jgi:ABC-type nitrate/sulfonate/bicarbonate transport system substrate-binding protein
MVDPAATQSEKEGSVVRWASYPEVVPWYQSLVVAASDAALQRNATLVQKFLEVYVLTAREVNASNGEWTDEMVGIMSKRAGVDPQIIRDQGGVPYYDPNGTASHESLEKSQEIWVREQQVRNPVDIARLLEEQPLQLALAAVGRAS